MKIGLKGLIFGLFLSITVSMQAAWHAVDQASWQQWEADRASREVYQFRLQRLDGVAVVGGTKINKLGVCINMLIDKITGNAKSPQINAFLKENLSFAQETLPLGVFIFRDSKNFRQLLALAERQKRGDVVEHLLDYAVDEHNNSLVCFACYYVAETSEELISHKETQGKHGLDKYTFCD